MQQKVNITQDGLDAVKAEHAELTGVRRPNIVEKIKSARCVNDRSGLSPASRAHYLFGAWYLGLTPQALCCRALRALLKNRRIAESQS